MSKEPNKNNEPNNEARVLSDEELEGIVGGGFTPKEIQLNYDAAYLSSQAFKGIPEPGEG